MTDGDLIAGFTQHQHRRALEPTTIGIRARRLRHFSRWLGERSLIDATSEDVNAFLDTRRINARSRYAWISHLHCFYKWAVDEGLVDLDPTTRIIRPKLPRLLPRPIGTADLAFATKMADRRMRCWLLLAAYEGFRCVEISRLTREDVLDTYHPPVIIARGKGSKERVIPLHPDVLAELVALPMPTHGAVFICPGTRRPFTPAAISQAGGEFLHGVGIDATLHKLRHWFGTQLYQQTRDLRLVQELLGHSSPATTAGYAAYAAGQAKAAVEHLSFEERHDAPSS